MWLGLAFISACLLGLYDLCKKVSLDKNAVIPVLFLNTLFCSLFFVPLLILSRCQPEWMQQTVVYIPPLQSGAHLYLLLKAVIVLSSWILAYFAMKHLPLTLSAPIKASQPVLTLLGALLIFGERLNIYQWIGVLSAILSFYMLSISGKKEGIRFAHNKWIGFIVLATITGAMSGLYDKYLLKHFDPMTVQVWYTFYQMGIMFFILMILWYPKRKETTPFVWRNSIFFISLFLTLADFVYFYALSYPDSMISIISMVRRSSVVVSFIGGALLLREKNIRSKVPDLILVLIGMLFLYLGSRLS